MSDKVYVGTRKGDWVESVTVNGRPLLNYDRYGDPENGFEWGYGGAGPHALATSILCDHFDLPPTSNPDEEYGSQPYQRLRRAFKEEVIARFPRSGFTLTSEEIDDWVAIKESESRTQESRS